MIFFLRLLLSCLERFDFGNAMQYNHAPNTPTGIPLNSHGQN